MPCLSLSNENNLDSCKDFRVDFKDFVFPQFVEAGSDPHEENLYHLVVLVQVYCMLFHNLIPLFVQNAVNRLQWEGIAMSSLIYLCCHLSYKMYFTYDSYSLKFIE